MAKAPAAPPGFPSKPADFGTQSYFAIHWWTWHGRARCRRPGRWSGWWWHRRARVAFQAAWMVLASVVAVEAELLAQAERSPVVAVPEAVASVAAALGGGGFGGGGGGFGPGVGRLGQLAHVGPSVVAAWRWTAGPRAASAWAMAWQDEATCPSTGPPPPHRPSRVRSSAFARPDRRAERLRRNAALAAGARPAERHGRGRF